MKTRVDTLVRVRSIQRDQRARDLAAAEAAVSEALARAAQIGQALARTLQEYDTARIGPTSPEVLSLFENYLVAKRRDLSAVEAEIEDLRAETERRRVTLQAAVKELESYERYRERLIDEHREESKTRDGRQMDEFALRGFSHRPN